MLLGELLRERFLAGLYLSFGGGFIYLLFWDRNGAEEVICNGWGTKEVIIGVVLRCTFFLQRWRSVFSSVEMLGSLRKIRTWMRTRETS